MFAQPYGLLMNENVMRGVQKTGCHLDPSKRVSTVNEDENER